MAIRSTRPRLLFVALAFASLASAGWGPGGGLYGGFGGDAPGQGDDNSNNNNSPSAFFNGRHSGDDGFNSGEGLDLLRSGIDFNKAARARLAHGILASLAMVFFFPLGGIAIRILPGPLAIVVHASLQLFGYLLFTAAVGLGLWMTVEVRFGDFHLLNYYHPIIGLVLFGVLFFQPLSGILHHLSFRRHGRRGLFSYIHLGIGRLAITLGIINGGFGLQLAGNASKGQIAAYSVVAVVMWLLWVGAALFGEIRRRRRDPAMVDAVTPGQHHTGVKSHRSLSRSPSLPASR